MKPKPLPIDKASQAAISDPDATREEQFLALVGAAAGQLGGIPDHLVSVLEDGSRVRISIRSTMEMPLQYSDWVGLTLSFEQFQNLTEGFVSVIKDVSKKMKK